MKATGDATNYLLNPVDGDGNKEAKEGLKHKLTPFQASTSLFKVIIGVGSFLLPHAVGNGGLIAGSIGIIILGLLSVYTLKILYRSERIIHQLQLQDGKDISFTYQQVVAIAVHKHMGNLVFMGIVLLILGVCSVYMNFVGSMVSDVSRGAVHPTYIKLGAIPVLVAMAWIRSAKYLSFTSLLGDIAVMGGIIVVLVDGFAYNTVDVPPSELPRFEISTLALFFAETVFVFAVHGVCLPIGQSMRDPNKFQIVINYVFMACVIGNSIFGVVCYILYDGDPDGIVLNNITPGAVQDTVKMMVAVDLFFTIPIQLQAPREMLENLIIPVDEPARLKRNIIRIILVLIFSGFSILIPDVNDMASLVGGIVSPLVSFIMPAILYMKAKSLQKDGMSLLQKVCHVLIVVFGVVGCVIATYQTIETIATGE